MKSLLILVLLVALGGALFFTRPTSDDFNGYVLAHPEIVIGQAAKGDLVTDKVMHQMRTFAGSSVSPTLDPVQSYIDRCTFDNYIAWTNVKKDGQVIYTGVVGHWFKREPAATAAKTST